MTYGELRHGLSKEFPGIDLDLLDGWIQEKHQEILDFVPWRSQEGETVLQVAPSYSTGTVIITQGSSALVGVGTTWTAAMGGCMLRVNNSREYYFFTFVDPTHGTLDRPFESADVAAVTYRLDRNVFPLPLAARIVRAVRPVNGNYPIELVSMAELNRIAGNRPDYSTPRYAAVSWDSYSDPPIQQLEFYPVPQCLDSSGALPSYAVDHIYDAAALNGRTTSAGLLPWMRPGALKAGVRAAAWASKAFPGAPNLAMAQFHTKEMDSLVQKMGMTNALQRGPQSMRLAPELRRSPLGSRPRRFHDGPDFLREGGNG